MRESLHACARVLDGEGCDDGSAKFKVRMGGGGGGGMYILEGGREGGRRRASRDKVGGTMEGRGPRIEASADSGPWWAGCVCAFINLVRHHIMLIM